MQVKSSDSAWAQFSDTVNFYKLDFVDWELWVRFLGQREMEKIEIGSQLERRFNGFRSWIDNQQESRNTSKLKTMGEKTEVKTNTNGAHNETTINPVQSETAVVNPAQSHTVVNPVQPQAPASPVGQDTIVHRLSRSQLSRSQLSRSQSLRFSLISRRQRRSASRRMSESSTRTALSRPKTRKSMARSR
jgi:hypothetical protein